MENRKREETFVHYRIFTVGLESDSVTICPRGGVTFCVKEVESGIQIGVAECSPKDNYWKALGRKICRNRIANGISIVYETDIDHSKEMILNLVERHIKNIAAEYFNYWYPKLPFDSFLIPNSVLRIDGKELDLNV